MAVCREEDRGEGTNSFERTEKSVNPKLLRNCFLLSADTTVTTLFLLQLGSNIAFLFGVWPFYSTICITNIFIGEHHKPQHLLKAHSAVMLSVSSYELLKYKHFASSVISELKRRQLFESLAMKYKYCYVQIKNSRTGCWPYFSLATWSSVQPFLIFRINCIANAPYLVCNMTSDSESNAAILCVCENVAAYHIYMLPLTNIWLCIWLIWLCVGKPRAEIK